MSERIPCDRRSAGFLQRNTLPHAMCEISDLRDTIYHKYFSMIRRSFYLCQSNHGVSPIRLTVNCEIGSDTYLVYQLTYNRVPQNFSRSKLVFWRGARDLTHSKRTIVYILLGFWLSGSWAAPSCYMRKSKPNVLGFFVSNIIGIAIFALSWTNSNVEYSFPLFFNCIYLPCICRAG